MRTVRIPRPFAAIAFAAAVACSADPIVLCACSQVPPHTILYGTVTNPAGPGVLGALVQVQAGPPDCQSGSSLSGVSTDGAGRYRAPIHPTGDYAQQCIRVWARAPVGSGLRDSDTLQFTIATPQDVGADSVRRDVALPTP